MSTVDDVARLTRLTRYLAQQVTAGDLVPQPSDAGVWAVRGGGTV
ncbi:hypothetical protein [Actinomyces faecalis]|nr:hypothetical protein [Actinomyces faecalis]